MNRYSRYSIPFAFELVAVGFLSLFAFAPTQYADDPLLPKSYFWPTAAVLFFFMLLSVWGMIGVALSKIKEKAGELALREVTISKKSWHYRLNTWANFGKEPLKARSECEYWARLFHGLCGTPLAKMLIYVVSTIILLFGWFCGARLSGLNIFGDKGTELAFKSGHQFVGPTVFALMLIGGLAAGLTLSGAGASIQHIPPPTVGMGKWAGVVIGSLIGAVFALLLLAVLVRTMGSLFSYITARVIGVCRPIQFTD